MTITREQFIEKMQVLLDWDKEKEKLQNVVELLCPSSYTMVEFGSTFTAEYIKLLSMMVGDEGDWIDWYIYENDFGKNGDKLACFCNDVEYQITDAGKLYDFMKLVVKPKEDVPDELKGEVL